jgi:diguanylate cyclase (GGDEF)-like protein
MTEDTTAPAMASAFVVNGTSASWLLTREGRTAWSTVGPDGAFAHLAGIGGVLEMVGRLHPDDREPALAWWQAVVDTSAPGAATLRVRGPDGGWLTVDVEAHDLSASASGTTGILVTALDVTRRARAERWLVACNALLGDMARDVSGRVLLDHLVRLVEAEIHGSRCTVMLASPDRRTLSVGAAPGFPPTLAEALANLPVGTRGGACGSAAARRTTVIVPDTSGDPTWQPFRELTRSHQIVGCWSTPFFGGDDSAVLGTFAVYFDRVRTPSEDELNLLHDAGRVAALICQSQASRAALRTMAMTDGLTGLGNRNAGRIVLRTAREDAERSGRSYAVVSVDVDDFRAVNESLGHAAGDQLLRRVAQRLVTATGGRGEVVRLGGDEFLVVMMVDDEVAAKDLACDLHRSLDEPIDVVGHRTHTSASIGVAVLTAESDVDPLAAATLAMTVASTDGGGQTAVYTAQMQAESDDYFALAQDLRTALASAGLTLAYEPIVDLRSGSAVRLEALSRWPHPVRGMVSPGVFIPVAERSGLIVELGAQVLQRACGDVAVARAAGHDLGLSVNVSVRQLIDQGLSDTVGSALEATGLAPEVLTLELTESVLFEEDRRAHQTLATLHALGVRISVDDFGTGYSSLSYLRRFQFDELKLDHTFIAEIGVDDRVRSMVASVVSLGHDLDIPVVAEGVETEDQARALRAMGCPLAQGWLFAGLTPDLSLLSR